ncbi:alpha/beta hydrolase [Curtobacterium sp. MCSS17_015]|uniref:alpha/beta hydrolase n=1 Tax=Curtobacterium sp. MCSS17_015 TaxID=2175666 RepID=UPI0015E8BDC7|nr:alpha/beta hydrolase [Curtobacterium sp. MCSS17_015]WIB27266.1 alpha/beta hydrolase [Curtobacterium sp. MCSS17_015]
MGIEFDDAAAVRLLSCATEVALSLRASGAARRAAAEHALHDFHGAYARLFEQARTIESEDRVRLVRALDDLAGQLHVLRRQAHDEQRRQHDLAAWRERERQRDQVLVGIGAPVRSALDWSDAVIDPKPSEMPVRPTPLTAWFRARARVRTSSGGSGGRSGADPERLRRSAARARAQDAATAQELTRVRNAWVTFTRTCAWVPVDDATLVPGFEDHLAENAADAAWLDRIADAFAAAGGGSLSDGVLDVAGASRLPGELQRVLDPSSTTVEVAAAWHALGLSDQDVDALPLTTKLQLAGIDGLPAAVRDIASRAVLRAAVADPGRVYRMLGLPYTYGAVDLEEFTRQVVALRDGLERADQSAARLAPPSAKVAQLVGFGASNGALVAAISLGDLDTASNVTVNVPGATTTVGSASEKVRAAHGLLSTAARLDQKSSFAVVSWFGYRAPSFPEVPGRGRASTGGANLASFLDGVVDARADRPPRSTTVLGHSYGSTTAAEALAQARHRIDSFVTYGSVGFTETTKPDHLNAHRVFATEGRDDHVAALGRSNRTDPRDLRGVEVFSSEVGPGTKAVTGHEMCPRHGVGYLSSGSTAQRHIAEIIADGEPA